MKISAYNVLFLFIFLSCSSDTKFSDVSIGVTDFSHSKYHIKFKTDTDKEANISYWDNENDKKIIPANCNKKKFFDILNHSYVVTKYNIVRKNMKKIEPCIIKKIAIGIKINELRILFSTSLSIRFFQNCA